LPDMGTKSFTVTIESLSYGGRGVGKREDGKVVFVPSVIPGERVRVHVYKELSSYILAGIDEVLDFSPYRVEPRCSLFPQCGGCDWQHLTYTQQVLWKKKILEDEIVKVCKILPEIEQEPVPSEKIYGYRGHTVVQCTYDPEFSMGFFQKRSKRIVGFDHCPVLNPQIQKVLNELKEIFRRNPVYGIYSLEVHAPQNDIILLARCKGTTHKKDLKTMDRIYNELDIAGVSFVMFGARRSDHVLGQRFCRYEIPTPTSDVLLSSGFGGFIQANMEINAALVEYVMQLVQDSDTILDLYSGSGNFSIPIAQLGKEVVAIERNPRLASQGKMNAKKNNAENVRFLSMDVKKAVESIKRELLKFDTIILDPPRQGANEIVKTLPELGGSRIIYISCNPSTLARDLKSLIDSGFSLKYTRVFDMFPQTYHIESVSYLER
jgi:23S rRNA (uracil1939-C5)-methyltransferase